MDEDYFWCDKCKKFFLVKKTGDRCPTCGITVSEQTYGVP
jgi:Zn finger protein HypA/HybF involved in hydrogenase expression